MFVTMESEQNLHFLISNETALGPRQGTDGRQASSESLAGIGWHSMDGEDRVSDQLRELRDDAVSVGGDAGASHLVGKPIIHSTKIRSACGPMMPRACAVSESGRELRAIVSGDALPLRQSLLVGVGSIPNIARAPGHFASMAGASMLPFAVGVRQAGNDDDALPGMIGSEVRSTHHERPIGVTDLFQPTEHPVDSATADARNVLSANPIGSAFVDEAKPLHKESGSLSVESSASGVGAARILARRASDNDVGKSSICPQTVGGEGSNVIVHPHAGEISQVLRTAPRIDFASRDGFEASRSVEAEAPTTGGAGEEVEDTETWISIGDASRDLDRKSVV